MVLIIIAQYVYLVLQKDVTCISTKMNKYVLIHMMVWSQFIAKSIKLYMTQSGTGQQIERF